jgi:hypothetical protein
MLFTQAIVTVSNALHVSYLIVTKMRNISLMHSPSSSMSYSWPYFTIHLFSFKS